MQMLGLNPDLSKMKACTLLYPTFICIADCGSVSSLFQVLILLHIFTLCVFLPLPFF